MLQNAMPSQRKLGIGLTNLLKFIQENERCPSETNPVLKGIATVTRVVNRKLEASETNPVLKGIATGQPYLLKAEVLSETNPVLKGIAT